MKLSYIESFKITMAALSNAVGLVFYAATHSAKFVFNTIKK